jgi:hypothetical protein
VYASAVKFFPGNWFYRNVFVELHDYKRDRVKAEVDSGKYAK